MEIHTPSVVHHDTAREPWFSYLRDGKCRMHCRLATARSLTIQAGDVLVMHQSGAKSSSRDSHTFQLLVTHVSRHETLEKALLEVGVENVLPGMDTLDKGIAVLHQRFPEARESQHGAQLIGVEPCVMSKPGSTVASPQLAGRRRSLSVSLQSPAGVVWTWRSNEASSPSRDLHAESAMQSVCFGRNHAVFVTEDGAVCASGANNRGQLGQGTVDEESNPKPLIIPSFNRVQVQAVACGHAHSLVLAKDGAVWSWGQAREGQCGRGQRQDNFPEPQVVDFGGKMECTKIACGDTYSLAVGSDGSCWSWGTGIALGLGERFTSSPRPVRIEAFAKHRVVDLASGSGHVLAVVMPRSADSRRPNNANHQVWSWGRGDCGQLGHGTLVNQFLPKRVIGLDSVRVVRIAAGGCHSGAITCLAHVYTWGSNSSGQLGHSDLRACPRPTLVAGVIGKGIYAMAAGQRHCLFLGAQGPGYRQKLYFTGPVTESTVTSAQDSARVKEVVLPPEVKNVRAMACGSGCAIISDDQVVPQARALRELVCSDIAFLNELRVILRAGLRPLRSAIESMASSTTETTCLEELMASCSTVWQTSCQASHLLSQSLYPWCTPVQVAEGIEASQLLEAYESFSVSFANAVAVGTFRNITFQRVVEENLLHTGQLLFANQTFGEGDEYGQLWALFSAPLKRMGVYEWLMVQLSSAVVEKRHQEHQLHLSNPDLSSRDAADAQATAATATAKRSSSDGDLGKQAGMKAGTDDGLTQHAENGVHDTSGDSIDDFSDAMEGHLPQPSVSDADDEHSEDNRLKQEALQLHALAAKWSDLAKTANANLSLAQETSQFWLQFPQLQKTFATPTRRVLHHSKSNALNSQRSVLQTATWYILFNDSLIQNQMFSTREFPLSTVWVLQSLDSETARAEFRIVTPEETFVVFTPTAKEQEQWQRWILEAVVSRCCRRRPDGTLVFDEPGSKLGSIKFADVVDQLDKRVATYSFQNHPVYRQCTYFGEWLQGQPQGQGEMQCADGRIFSGEFKQGVCDGDAQVINTQPGTSPIRLARGMWKGGKMHGNGVAEYFDGNRYEGSWVEGSRHGFGSLTTTLGDAYVGSWENDVKSGYGVMDDVGQKHKYLGQWHEGQRHGAGAVVRSDGIFYEGYFANGKLSGRGILIDVDGTVVNADFVGDCVLQGRGCLTYPNGDQLDGTFTGLWHSPTTLKMANVVLRRAPPGTGKTPVEERMDQIAAGTLTYHDSRGAVAVSTDDHRTPRTRPEHKWESVFARCKREIVALRSVRAGVPVEYTSEALSRSSSSNESFSGSSSNRIGVEVLPSSIDDIVAFVEEGMQSQTHPFGALLNSLVTAFQACYKGAGAHKRLLTSAVDDMETMLLQFEELLCVLFPEWSSDTLVFGRQQTTSGHPTFASTPRISLLEPRLLSRTYSTLFTLYILNTEELDGVYWKSVRVLNLFSDSLLFARLRVNPKFWLLQQDVHSEGLSVEDGRCLSSTPKPSRAYQTLARLEPSPPEHPWSPSLADEHMTPPRTPPHDEERSSDLSTCSEDSCDSACPTPQILVDGAAAPHLDEPITSPTKATPNDTVFEDAAAVSEDVATASFVSFAGSSSSSSSSSSRHSLSPTPPPEPYAKAIQTLRGISTVFTAREKVAVLSSALSDINAAIDARWHGKEKLSSLDDILPLVMALLIRAKVPSLGAEIQYLDDFTHRSALSGESRFMLTTLRACYYQLLMELDDLKL